MFAENDWRILSKGNKIYLHMITYFYKQSIVTSGTEADEMTLTRGLFEKVKGEDDGGFY